MDATPRAALHLALVLVVAGAGSAAIVTTATSHLATGATAPPVEWELGSGASATRHFASFGLGANKTLASGTVLAKAGADLHVKDVLRLVNRGPAAQTVTLSSTQVTNALVEVLAWTAREGATTLGVLDHRAASPSLTLGLPAGASRTLDLRVDLADAAGANNATLALDLRIGLSPTGGGIALTHASAPALVPRTTEAPMGRLAAQSGVGSNATNATASTAGALVSTTTDLLYLNNTDATAPTYARLVLTSSSGLGNVVSMQVGIKNGSAQAVQVAGTGGSVTQSDGSYVRLEPGSVNRIYLTQTVGLLFSGGARLDMDLLVSDDLAESATVRAKVRVTIT